MKMKEKETLLHIILYSRILNDKNNSILRSKERDVLQSLFQQALILRNGDSHRTAWDPFRKVSHRVEHGLLHNFLNLGEYDHRGVHEVLGPVGTPLLVQAHVPINPAHQIVVQILDKINLFLLVLT